ncbi:MAG: hypothetical protein AAGC56_05765 [Pseudomonadota bacterium]
MAAVEIESRYAEQLEEALSTNDAAEALVASMPTFWTRQDGRASEAVLQFLVRIAEFRRQGMQIEVVPFVNMSKDAFDALVQGDQSLVERDYANAVMTGARQGDRTIVMVGGVHASKMKGQYTFVDYAPMASYFPKGSVALDFAHDAGAAWAQTRGQSGVRESGASTLRPSEPGFPRIVFDSQLEPFFDGYLYVGPLTASPPVVRVPTSDE